MFQPGQCIKVQLNKQVKNLYLLLFTNLVVRIIQDFCAIVKIPAGDHGEVSKGFSRTTADIRSRPIYKSGGHFDPSGLLAIIQARLVLSTYMWC